MYFKKIAMVLASSTLHEVQMFCLTQGWYTQITSQGRESHHCLGLLCCLSCDCDLFLHGMSFRLPAGSVAVLAACTCVVLCQMVL